MGSEHELAIILDVVIHWIALTLFKVGVHLWSQNVLEAHNLKFFTGELEVGAFIAHGSSYICRSLNLPFFSLQGWNL